MFDFGIGTSELLLIAMVALIVVGPKELPGLMRTIGQWVGKVRALAADFQGHLDRLADESGVKEVKEKVEKDIGDLSIEDLDREFNAIEREMREQLAEGAQRRDGPKVADDEDLIEEEERPLPKTLDLDAEGAGEKKSGKIADAGGAAKAKEAPSGKQAEGGPVAAEDGVNEAGRKAGEKRKNTVAAGE